MAVLTVLNVPDEVHRALRGRAAQHGRSIEVEILEILASAVKPQQRLRLGDALSDLRRNAGLSNEDYSVFEQMRDSAPAEPLGFK